MQTQMQTEKKRKKDWSLRNPRQRLKENGKTYVEERKFFLEKKGVGLQKNRELTRLL